MRVRNVHEKGLADGTYVELVRSLFATLAPATIMGILFIVVAAMAVERHDDAPLALLGVLGGGASLVRVAVTAAFERRAGEGALDLASASMAERWFGWTYIGFATLLGLFAARALRVCDAEMQTVVAALVVGYAAGVAAGISLRPRISVPAVLIAVLPPAASAAAGGDAAHRVLAFVLVALLAGGIGSMLARYRSEADKITMRQAFASLARTDHLTGLANRLGLAEAFSRAIETGTPERLAVHCLDLDRFKAVNDQHGHPAGDSLLVQVADRLRSIARAGDTTARLGGDEFVLLQTQVGHPGEVDLMARRIVRALNGPYAIAGRSVAVGTSLGYAVPEGCGHDLPHLLGCADEALYRVKRDGGGAAASAQRAADEFAATA